MSGFGRDRGDKGAGYDPINEPRVTHFLYFDARATAEAAGEAARVSGYDIDVLKSADDRQWLLLAVGVARDETMMDSREYFEDLAGSLGGEYDGWEMGPMARP